MTIMSKKIYDNDGFQIVSSRKACKNKLTKIPAKDTFINNEDVEINIEKAKRYLIIQISF